MEMYCGSSSTCGDDSGFRLYRWRCSSKCMAAAPGLWLLALAGTDVTGTSPPMEMNCDYSSTYGDDFGFRRHPWRCSSNHPPAVSRSSRAAVFGARAPCISPPMEMNCDYSFTYGDDFGFRLRLWRFPPDGLPEAARSSRTALLGPGA